MYIFIDNALLQALIFGYLALSVYISLRVLDFPDLTIEGSFPLGAAIAATATVHFDQPVLGAIIAVIAGYLAGMLTGFLHEYLRIGKLLSGIAVATALYSVSFRIMGANANLYLERSDNPFASLDELNRYIAQGFWGDFGNAAIYPMTNLILILLAGLSIFLLVRFFVTVPGTLLKFSRSDSRAVIGAVGFNGKLLMLHGMGMANGFAAFAGVRSLFNDGTASISMGFGIILTALAALVLGERIISLFHHDLFDIWPMLLAPFIGMFCYHVIIKAVRTINVYIQISFGIFDPHDQLQFFNTDIRILSALIIVLLYMRQQSASNGNGMFDKL